MTLPVERQRTVQWVRAFLYDLCDPKATPKVPRTIRTRARHLLRHYPEPTLVDEITWEFP